MKKGMESIKPWCPFCGVDVGRTRDAVQRKMTEFPVGQCDCGAVYVCDASGHNVGAAIVECLVFACHNDWDLAWELIPEDDYLTGRIENYDEITHQVVLGGKLDGRMIRGVLYFIRLHKEVAEIAARFTAKQQSEEEAGPDGALPLPPLEPLRDPKRQRKRASKELVRQLVRAGDIDALVDYSFDDHRTLRFLQRLLYDPDEAARYHTAWLIGQVCARLATREPGQVADLMHRLFEACSDSAATSWGMLEAIGAIIAARPDIYGAFTRYLLNFMADESTQVQVIWSLGEIAASRPDLIRKTPFYSTFSFLSHKNPVIRGLMARLLGRIQASEALFQIMGLQADHHPIIIYEQGRPVNTTVSRLATEATENIHRNKEAIHD
ncbi:MAG TPA: PBS lyase [Desulfobulbaceae bacterium]|nr:PBS lyase [Desulfobulbaceae bacterium]